MLPVLVPGVGPALRGRPLLATAMFLQLGLLLWAGISGFSRLGDVLGLSGDGLSAHGIVAVVSWFIATALLYRVAWNEAHPKPIPRSEELQTRALIAREFRRNRNGALGLMGVTLLISITLLAPMIAPYHPDAVDLGPKLMKPSGDFLMGTDEYGRDVFSRVLFGARISMIIGFIAVSIAATLGTVLGAIAGWFGGTTDRAIMWIVDLLLSVPRLILLLAIVGLFRPTGSQAIFLIVVILGLTGWMGVSRIVRGQVLSLKAQDFIAAARALGFSHSRVIFNHLIPNAIAPVIVYCSLAIGATMLAEASLSFLGLGVAPPTSTWGTLVADGRSKLLIAPWIAVFPGLFIMTAVMSFNLLGDGLRDALDPKQRTQ